jgi:hypothetical protein
MRLIAVSVLVLVVVVAAAAGVSIYTWGWRNNGTPEQSAESTERAEALGAARELSLAYANHIRYIRFGDAERPTERPAVMTATPTTTGTSTRSSPPDCSRQPWNDGLDGQTRT